MYWLFATSQVSAKAGKVTVMRTDTRGGWSHEMKVSCRVQSAAVRPYPPSILHSYPHSYSY